MRNASTTKRAVATTTTNKQKEAARRAGGISMEQVILKQKRSRAPNYTDGERDYLLQLMERKYKLWVKCKTTDAVSPAEKKCKWLELCTEFNATCTVHHRSVQNLMDLWDNLKKSARKAAAHERAENVKTGTFHSFFFTS